MRFLVIFGKECRYRWFLFPLTIVLILVLTEVFGPTADTLESFIILVPLAVSFTLLRGGRGEQEIITASGTSISTILAIRVAVSYLLINVTSALYIFATFRVEIPSKYMLMYLALSMVATALTVLWRVITGSTVGSALLAISTMLFFEKVVAFRGFLRYFQVYRSMGLASQKLFYSSRWYLIAISAAVILICCVIWRFKERSGKNI